MLIASKCAGCQSEFRFPEDWAGTEVHCAKCGQVLVVPMPAEETVVLATLAEPKEEKPKPSPPPSRSASVVGALALLLLFLMGLFGVGAFATIWIATHLGPPIQLTSAPPLHVFRPGLEVKQKDFRDGFVVKKIVDRDKEFKQKEMKKFVDNGIALQRIIVALDGQGKYSETREFTPRDPTRLGRGSYKEYLVGLEKEKKYRVVMSLHDSLTSVEVFDPNNVQFKAEFNKKDASVTFTANQTGVYAIHVIAPLPKDRAAYTLRITTEP